MSRDYGKVRTQFWDDDALRELSIEANYLAIYLITSRHTNAIGCFRLPPAYILNDTRLDKKAMERALAELRSAGYAMPCERAPWIYIPNFLRHNPPENPNVWRKCAKELDALPSGILAADNIASELIALAGEERMSKEGSRNRVSDEEIGRLQRYRNGIGTVSEGLIAQRETVSEGLIAPHEPVSEGLTPLPSPNHILSKPTLSADADGVCGDDPEFEEFWKSYKPPPNSKKPDARKAWAATKGLRPPLPDLLRSVQGYLCWLAEESRKQKREYPKQHPATWLRGEVWSGFAPSGPQMTPAQMAEQKDRRDRLMRQGAYAPNYQ